MASPTARGFDTVTPGAFIAKWQASELKERSASQEHFADLLQTDGEPDVDEFWNDVSTNLAARQLRLLFVADHIPDPLAQVVAFLNAQMPGIEVLAVEVKRFHGQSAQTLVPRVIGRTPAVSARGRTGQRLTRESFLEGFEGEEVRQAAARLLDAASQAGAEIFYGDSFGLSIRAKSPVWPKPISVAWLYSLPGKGWMRTRDFSFGTGLLGNELPEELATKLELRAGQFAADDFAENASSKGVAAWAVRHDLAVRHQDILASRLRTIISEIVSLKLPSHIEDE